LAVVGGQLSNRQGVRYKPGAMNILSTLTPVLRVMHLFVTLAMIGVVLIQRSEGGGLGIGTSQGMGAFMSGRGTANLLTRTTAILATLFFGISLSLALLNKGTSVGHDILAVPPANAVPKAPLPTAPSAPPAAPQAPKVPTK
jgi:preprotein translocase subunit SecG